MAHWEQGPIVSAPQPLSMKWAAEPKHLPTHRFVIEHDPAVGFYLYVFDGDRCIRDYLQDTLQFAMSLAHEQFGVSPAEWTTA